MFSNSKNNTPRSYADTSVGNYLSNTKTPKGFDSCSLKFKNPSQLNPYLKSNNVNINKNVENSGRVGYSQIYRTLITILLVTVQQ